MLYVGLDLSRNRLDFHALREGGELVERGAVPADREGLARLVYLLGGHDLQVAAVIESMNGARFVHDQLELAGFEVEIADAQRVKGLAPLACKTDRIDAWVLAELARRDLVPAIWLPDPAVRAERERARFRLHLVRQRTRLKNRVHATLIAHGHPCPVSDLFGTRGRKLLERLALPEPWRGTLEASLRVSRRKRAQYPGPRGSKIAAICVARKLAEAIWHMLTRDQHFAPAGATRPLTA
jgi:transposase